MAVVFAQNVIEIAVNAEVGGKPHTNVFHYWSEEGGEDDEDAVRDFANGWQDHVMSLMQDAYVLREFVWRSIDPDDTNTGVLLPDPAKNLAGVGTTDAAPPNVCYLIKKHTAHRPRGRRDGRFFLSGIREDHIDEAGNILEATVTAWNEMLADFIEAISNDGTVGIQRHMAVLETTPASREPGTAEHTLNSREVTSLTLDSLVSNQRDRLAR